jgi:intein-encoded DNA endonuclease-like protein
MLKLTDEQNKDIKKLKSLNSFKAKKVLPFIKDNIDELTSNNVSLKDIAEIISVELNINLNYHAFWRWCQKNSQREPKAKEEKEVVEGPKKIEKERDQRKAYRQKSRV